MIDHAGIYRARHRFEVGDTPGRGPRWHSGGVPEIPVPDATADADLREQEAAYLADLERLVPAWIAVPDAAHRQGVPVSAVRRQLKDRELLGARRGPNNAVYLPDDFVTEEGPRPELRGTFTVLSDGGMSDLELLVWLFTEQEDLRGGTPMGALLAGHKTEVRRRAMETAF